MATSSFWPAPSVVADSPVRSVNGAVGDVVLAAADVGAVATVNGESGPAVSLSAADIGAVATVNGESGPTVSLSAADVGAPSTAQVREVLTAARTYYVRTDGNDANTGLVDSAAGAFLTIQKAVDTVAGLDLSIYQATIQLGTGTFTVSTAILLKKCIGSLVPEIRANPADPTATVVTRSTTGHVFYHEATGQGWKLTGFSVSNSGAGSSDGIYAFSGAVLTLTSMHLGAVTRNGIHSNMNSLITIATALTVAGAMSNVFSVANGGRLLMSGNPTITISGTPAWSGAFAFVTTGSGFYAVATYSGSATGSRYNVNNNGTIETSGGGANYLPGNSAGTSATGGQYT